MKRAGGDGNEVTTVSGVTFGNSTGYLALPPGDYAVVVKKGGTEVLSIPLSVAAGTKYTGYVIGTASPEDNADEDTLETDEEESLSATTTVDATSSDDEEEEDEEEEDEEEEDEEEEDDERGRGRGD